ncbi:methyltransferase domain-containing protein [Kerstersia gyiorum]|jgi:SAM-dependent methyltransferase|uniref:methyltransferase domain-containing protein n=1 Tax=Kerstersia gyiorum TaxID=206506 RepID=UPI00242CC955|nr:methyltransferase domain-containing protein [Kerstersia gyiorum]MCI1228987.1 methyltransferase domain-containing protein [Kerstersia gyiorum]
MHNDIEPISHENKQLQQLDKLQREYAVKWEVSASAHQQEGDYEWLAADLEECHSVLEIGCGAGHSTLSLLAGGHRVTVVEENPHCIELTRDRLEQAGYRVQVMLRGNPEALDSGYEVAYGDVGTVENVDCVLIEGDVLEDAKLSAWLSKHERFDAVICWMMGTHQYRGHDGVLVARKITEVWQYRIFVQNEVYDLAEIVLRSGGILSVADRLETPSTERMHNSIMQNHREQASTTSLQVRKLRHKPYSLDRVEGGVQMVVTLPTDGSSADREFSSSLCVVTSVKP